MVTIILTIEQALALANVAQNGWGNGDFADLCEDGGKLTNEAINILIQSIKTAPGTVTGQ